MIASWIAYTALVSGLLAIAATALERVAQARRWPRRLVWIAALGASVAWPIGHAIRTAFPSDGEMLPFSITVAPMQIIADGPSRVSRAVMVDRGLIALWSIASVLLLFRLARGVVSLRRTRREWRHGTIDGTTVRLADNVGPAVIGLREMEVVLPEWIVTLDAPLRALVLCHEEEHRRARDPYLLFGAAVAVALMPWNVALWLQARRLRLAIEMDCDARVLRTYPSAERYGLLMLTIAQRKAAAPALFAPMLTEPTTQLERRIIEMRTTRRWTRASVAGAGMIAVAVVAFACTLQSDDITSPTAAASQNSSQAKSPAYFEFQVTKPAAPAPGNPSPRYPDLLRQSDVEGEVLAQFIVNRDGRADMGSFKVLKSSHELFTAAVRSSLPNMKFSPAEVSGAPVRQLLQMPFSFSLSKVGSEAKVGAAIVPQPERHVPPGTEPRPVQRGPERVSENQTMFEFQVEKPASPRPDNLPARYPDELREKRIEGEVFAQFVVDQSGSVDTSTFKVLKSSHELFVQAVRAALPGFRFNPAEVGGKPMKQLVQMPFQFSLTKQ